MEGIGTGTFDILNLERFLNDVAEDKEIAWRRSAANTVPLSANTRKHQGQKITPQNQILGHFNHPPEKQWVNNKVESRDRGYIEKTAYRGHKVVKNLPFLWSSGLKGTRGW